MDALDPATVETLRWLRTAKSPGRYELRDGERTVALLTFARHEGSLAEASTASESWTMKRVGFVHPQVSVRTAAGSPSTVGRLTIHFRRSLFERPGRPARFLERAGVAVPAWEARDLEGQRLFHLEPVAEGRELAGGLVSVEPKGRSAEDLLLILNLAWYYVALGWAEEELAASAASALVALS